MVITYISWAPHCSRSDHTARELGGRSHMVYVERLGSHPATVWLKYLVQAWRTWRVLGRERSDAVFVMSPPVFAALVVWAWCAMHRKRFVIDAHTAAFLHPRWKHWQGLQRALCRRAATTLVTNDHLASMVRAAGGHATIVRDVPVVFDSVASPPSDGPFTVAVVCSFNYDEPIGTVLEAARLEPEAQFVLTGDARRLAPVLRDQAPPNVRFTGFLSTSDYGRLLQTAGAVMALTTRNHTMLRGAWEAIYQGTPVIVSDWPVLRSAFDEGAVLVDNTAASIAAAVRTIRDRAPAFREAASRLRDRKLADFAAARAQILARLDLAAEGPALASGAPAGGQ